MKTGINTSCTTHIKSKAHIKLVIPDL